VKPYRIDLTKSAAKELGRLPTTTHDKIIDRLRELEEDPRLRGSEKLTAVDAYKLRVGNLRIIYQIDDAKREVRVVMVDDRKQIYKRLRRKS
jgi:mRNA interferase RelE/StbE